MRFRQQDGKLAKWIQIEKIYTFALNNNIFINEIKAQLYYEDLTNENKLVLYHGAKNILEGNIDIEHAKNNNDFGKGFYCGESFEQSSLFVSGFDTSSVYILSFNPQKLSSIEYKVNQEWMLPIAYFRGRLSEYENHPIIKKLINKLEDIDYLVAPETKSQGLFHQIQKEGTFCGLLHGAYA